MIADSGFQVKKYPLRSQVRLSDCGTATNSVSLTTTSQTQRRGITVVPKKKAKVADSTRNLGKFATLFFITSTVETQNFTINFYQ